MNRGPQRTPSWYVGISATWTTHAILLLLIASPLLSTAKRLPTRNIEPDFPEYEGGESEEVEETTTEIGESEDSTESTTQETSTEEDSLTKAALIARKVIHAADHVAISYVPENGDGTPVTFFMSMSDGPKNAGSGVPYFYVTDSKWGMQDLVEKEIECTIFVTRSKGSDCRNGRFPIEDYRCEHVLLTGKFQNITKASKEYENASTYFSARHPGRLRSDNEGFDSFLKFDIKKIFVYYSTDGPEEVPVNKYFIVAIIVIEESNDFGNAVGINKLFLLFTTIVSIAKWFT